MARSAWSSNNNNNFHRAINNAIRGDTAMVIDENGDVVGLMHMQEALQLARSKSLDLIELSRSPEHVVCKLYEYGKYKYEQEKKKSSKKNDVKKSKGQKEIQIKITSSEYDTKRKEVDIAKLIAARHKVRVTIVIPGRHVMYPETAMQKMQKIIENLSDVAKPEFEPKLEGKFLRAVMVCNKKPSKQAEDSKQSESEDS